ncbi:hypothetical protein [Nocardia farcinica]|uniref:hypothetical protein n=2 Tax=Nocardia farcinica TaxID=37329 RepID=UPI0024542B88|nr:hypothetical protein [Nocardia farcinica]
MTGTLIGRIGLGFNVFRETMGSDETPGVIIHWSRVRAPPAPQPRFQGKPDISGIRERGHLMRDVYTARVSPDGDALLIEVPEIDRVTQALHRGEVDVMARDLIAIMAEVEPDSFDLRIEWGDDIGVGEDSGRR